MKALILVGGFGTRLRPLVLLASGIRTDYSLVLDVDTSQTFSRGIISFALI